MINSYTITSQAVTTDDTLNFDTTRILTGCTVQHADGTPTFTLTKPGYYFITFNGEVTGTTAGVAVVELINGNLTIPAARASVAVTADEAASLSFAAIVRVLPSCPSIDNTTKLAILNSGVDTTFTNANINITKLC